MRCRASSRSCATVASSAWLPSAKNRRSPRPMRCAHMRCSKQTIELPDEAAIFERLTSDLIGSYPLVQGTPVEQPVPAVIEPATRAIPAPPRTAGHFSCTHRSARRQPWRSTPATSSRCIARARAYRCFSSHWHTRCGSSPRACASCMSRAQAATGTTAPTTLRSTRRCSRELCPDDRCCSSGTAATSTPTNPTAPRCASTSARASMPRAA